MSTTATITSTYAGKDAGVYVSALVKSADTIDKGLLTVLPNVKYKTSLHKLTLSGSTVNYACDFTAAGTVALSDVTLTPKKVMLNLQLCKNDFVSTWEAESMGFGADDKNLPASFQDYFIATVIAAQGAKIDQDIWQGNATASGEFDGFLTLAAVSGSGVVPVSGTTVTSANVIAEMTKIYAAVPAAVKNQPDFVIGVSQDIADAYMLAQAAGYTSSYALTQPLTFLGKKVEIIGGLPTHTAVAFQKANMFLATGLENDYNNVSILDMASVDLSDNVRFKMAYAIGVGFAVASEVVVYK